MAVVHFNTGCHASSEFRKMKLGVVSDACIVTKLENKRKRKTLQNAIARSKKPKVRRTEADRRPDVAYGGEYAEDMDRQSIQTAKSVIMEKLKHNQDMRISIEATTRDDEHYYFEKARNMLTSPFFTTITIRKDRHHMRKF